LAYLTLEDWGRAPSSVPQPLPVMVAFFSAAAARDFLRDLLARAEDDEGWDLPDSVKKNFRDGAVSVKPADETGAAR
jgi:hypothetical protein